MTQNIVDVEKILELMSANAELLQASPKVKKTATNPLSK
jgi:hypothetical protein